MWTQSIAVKLKGYCWFRWKHIIWNKIFSTTKEKRFVRRQTNVNAYHTISSEVPRKFESQVEIDEKIKMRMFYSLHHFYHCHEMCRLSFRKNLHLQIWYRQNQICNPIYGDSSEENTDKRGNLKSNDVINIVLLWKAAAVW